MIIDGKGIADLIQQEIKEIVGKISGRRPCLAVILVGEHPASKIYTARKAAACEETGIKSIRKTFPETLSEESLIDEIRLLNQDPDVDGILIQLPLPRQINSTRVFSAVLPGKDVDGFHPINFGKLLMGETDGFVPCTPYGIQVLLEKSGVNTAGLNTVIIGRSHIVGKPLAALLMQNAEGGNATVTVAHSHTKNIREYTLRADLIVTAMGSPLYLKRDMIKEGAIVIDVGINKWEDSSLPKGYRLVGDADFENIKEKCSLITPVPGGVGPMTIAMLLQNTLKSYRLRG